MYTICTQVLQLIFFFRFPSKVYIDFSSLPRFIACYFNSFHGAFQFLAQIQHRFVSGKHHLMQVGKISHALYAQREIICGTLLLELMSKLLREVCLYQHKAFLLNKTQHGKYIIIMMSITFDLVRKDSLVEVLRYSIFVRNGRQES